MTHVAFHRKYRPRSFDEVVGQEAIAQALKGAVTAQRTAPVYLFSGSHGVGKTSMARILAKALNCPNAQGGAPCLTCETCSARCPNGCDPARVIDAVREIAFEAGQAQMPRNIGAFHKAFLEQIRTNGRLHEMGLVMDYKIKTGDLMKDVTNAPAMFARGKLNLRADRIDGVNEIKRIFEQCGVTP